MTCFFFSPSQVMTRIVTFRGCQMWSMNCLPPGEHEFTPVVSVVSIVFCVMHCRQLFVLFHLAIVSSRLQFTVSNYPFGVFKLFLISIYLSIYILQYIE